MTFDEAARPVGSGQICPIGLLPRRWHPARRVAVPLRPATTAADAAILLALLLFTVRRYRLPWSALGVRRVTQRGRPGGGP
jgi:hypothetical protein